jgi:HJR/Mrr/RecB family endonuclease
MTGGIGFIITTLVSYWLTGKIKRKIYPEILNAEAYNRDIITYEKLLKEYKEWLRRSHSEYWYNLSGYQFEHAMAKVFRTEGYEATVTPGSGDGGVDIWLKRNGITIAVQCKAHKKPVGPSIIRELHGVIHNFGTDKGILICPSGFTKGVYEYVKGKPLILMDIDDILAYVSRS